MCVDIYEYAFKLCGSQELEKCFFLGYNLRLCIADKFNVE